MIRYCLARSLSGPMRPAQTVFALSSVSPGDGPRVAPATRGTPAFESPAGVVGAESSVSRSSRPWRSSRGRVAPRSRSSRLPLGLSGIGPPQESTAKIAKGAKMIRNGRTNGKQKRRAAARRRRVGGRYAILTEGLRGGCPPGPPHYISTTARVGVE